MQQKDFLFFLIDEQGRSYFVDNGIVKTQTMPKPLEYSPDGWQKLQIKWERNNNFYGVVRNCTLPLSFVYDGATILLSILLSKNFEQKVYLLVLKNTLDIDFVANDFAFINKYLYKGEVDLSTCKKTTVNDGNKVQVNIMEGGSSKYLKSRQNTTYEIPCNATDADCIPIRFNGINFKSKANFSFIDYEGSAYRIANLIFLNDEGDSVYIFKGNQKDEFIPSIDRLNFLVNSNNYFFLNAKPYESDMLISGTFKARNYDTGYNNTVNLKLLALNADNTNYAEILITTLSFTAGETQAKEINFSTTISSSNLFENKKLFIATTQAVAVGYIILESRISVELTTKLDNSIAYAHHPHKFFNRLSNKMTDSEFSGVSQLLTDNKTLVITSGNAIRQLSDATIKTSMLDFFNAYNVQLNAALTTTSTGYNIEQKEVFFNESANVVKLGIAKDLNITLAKDYLANTIKIGYPNQSGVITTNGKDEFNNTHLYQLPVNRVTKELNLVSPYRADGYGIEQIRMQTLGTDKVSNPGDNDTFIIEIENTPTTVNGVSAYNVKPLSNSTVITGLFAQNSAYNIVISPKRLFRKHTNYFQSILSGFDGEIITFQTTEQNANLKTIDGTIVYQENANITIGDAFYFNKTKLFQHYVFEFSAPMPNNIIEVLETDPNSVFEFIYNNVAYTGFLLSCSIEPVEKDAQQFTLLSTPSNNLKKLING